MATIDGGTELWDDTLLAASQLVGEGAVPLLSAAAGAIGARLVTAAIIQVDHEPGISCTVTYATQLDWPDGHRRAETFVAATTRRGPPEGAAVLTAADLEVGVWRHPFDPALPALVDAVHADRVAVRLGHVGPGPWQCCILSYRPGRRAVIRATSPTRTVFLKVVRPSKAGALALRHQVLHDAGAPVPQLVAADLDAGFLVLDALDGHPLRDRLVDPSAPPADRSTGAELLRMLDVLGAAELDGRPARRRPLDDVTAHASVLAAVLPDQAQRVHELVDRLDVGSPGADDAICAGITVHGDLHDAQLMVDERGQLTGLLDLDDAGRGARADDLGNLWGHATTIALVAQGPATGRWLRTVAGVVTRSNCDPVEVTRRAAAVVLSLATGPFRVRETGWEQATRHRITAAEQLVRDVSEQRHRRLIAADEV